MKKLYKKALRAAAKICIVDRFLILFMAVLLLYTLIHIFAGMSGAQEKNTIDVIVRTSLAAIFGYFVSGNFAASSTSGKPPYLEASSVSENRCSKTQIYIVALIGLASLVILIIARHSANSTSELTATVSQLRDFVASSIGFLVSCGKKQDS